MDIKRAGHAVAALTNRFLENDVANRSIVVLVGASQSAAVALTAARSLWQADAWLQIICTSPYAAYPDSIAVKLDELQKLGIPQAWAEEGWELPPSDLLIDAVFGSGVKEAAQGRAREIILLANSSAAPILSIDVPSGIDSDQGNVYKPHISAIATVMIGIPYRGVINSLARTHCGKLYLADAGISNAIYAEAGIHSPPLFDEDGLYLLAQ